MMNDTEYIVTARKWRPLSFEKVVGQSHITKTLENAINNQRVHHAYLFTGPRGVGKTTTARIYAKEVIKYGILQKDPNSSIDIDSLDTLDIIEIDGASNNSVEDIRTLRENSKYPPSIGKYKIYIIDEVHMLSTAAFNALLKTLEEPPPHLLFVFATTEPHKVPATIISRCQRFDFKRMSIQEIVDQLSMIASNDGIKVDEQSLITIAKKADGSMRDSQSIFDQAVAFCGTDIKYSELASALNLIDEEFFFRITDNILESNPADMFKIAQEVMNRGYDLRETLSGLMEHIRNILNIKAGTQDPLIDASSESIKRYNEIASKFSKFDLVIILDLTSETERELRFSLQPGIMFELCLVKLSLIDRTESINELIAEIRQGVPEKKNSNPVKNSPAVPEIIAKTTEKVQTNPVSEVKTNLKAKTETLATTETNLNTEPKVKANTETLAKAESKVKPVKTTTTFESRTQDYIEETELESSWGEFLNKVSTVSGLKILEDCFPKFLSGKIVLMTDNSFVKSNLDRKMSILLEELASHYGSAVEISLEHFESQDDEMQTGREYLKEYNQDDGNNQDADELRITMTKEEAIPYDKKTDIEKFIIDNFNAEEQLA